MFLLVVLLIVIASAVALGVILLTSSAIVFSRVACALLAALIAVQGKLTLVANSGFLNYVAWAAICLGIVYLLSIMPRVDAALKFFCSILMSVVVIEFVVMLMGSIIGAIAKKEFVMTGFFELLIKVVCVLFSVGAVVAQGKKAAYDSPTNPIVNLLERILSALLYGASATFLCTSLYGNWELSGVVLVLVLVAGTAVAFVGERYFENKNVFVQEEEETVYMPK